MNNNVNAIKIDKQAVNNKSASPKDNFQLILN